MNKQMNLKFKMIVVISFVLLSASIFLQTKDIFKNQDYEIKYEYINVKDMASTNVSTKVANKKSNSIITKNSIISNLTKLSYNDTPELSNLEAVDLPVQNNSSITVENRQIWYLPTEVGQISQYPNYWHVAYDITSPRGMAETIHPVANGTVSGMYTDSAGALIVTVLHDVDGKKYTSQYVHLSSYAQDLYVGKEVTINDALGQMGTTGRSTGVHLHLSVLDCALFDPQDPYCSDLGGWYSYDKLRLSQNFYGLGALMYMPNSWNSR